MAKGLLTIIGCCLCLIFSVQTNIIYAASEGKPVHMENHVEKVKLKNPAAYQEMVDKAGGNITNCVSCHVDMNKKKDLPSKTNTR